MGFALHIRTSILAYALRLYNASWVKYQLVFLSATLHATLALKVRGDHAEKSAQVQVLVKIPRLASLDKNITAISNRGTSERAESSSQYSFWSLNRQKNLKESYF